MPSSCAHPLAQLAAPAFAAFARARLRFDSPHLPPTAPPYTCPPHPIALFVGAPWTKFAGWQAIPHPQEHACSPLVCRQPHAAAAPLGPQPFPRRRGVPAPPAPLSSSLLLLRRRARCVASSARQRGNPGTRTGSSQPPPRPPPPPQPPSALCRVQRGDGHPKLLSGVNAQFGRDGREGQREREREKQQKSRYVYTGRFNKNGGSCGGRAASEQAAYSAAAWLLGRSPPTQQGNYSAGRRPAAGGLHQLSALFVCAGAAGTRRAAASLWGTLASTAWQEARHCPHGGKRIGSALRRQLAPGQETPGRGRVHGGGVLYCCGAAL